MSRETATNDGSITMHVVYGKTSFILTGDLPTQVEDWLVTLDGGDGELKTDVLKVGHHGSKFSTGSAWLAALNPEYAAISVGKKNRYGHPSPDALGRIEGQGATILRTDQVGTITFISDGKTIKEASSK
jgi:competence protein ComEC